MKPSVKHNSDFALIVQGDAAASLRWLSAEVYDSNDLPRPYTIATSIPYFQKFPYLIPEQEGAELEIGWGELSDYLNLLYEVFSAAYEAAQPGGAFWLNVGETWNNYSPVRTHQREARKSLQWAARRKLLDGFWEKEAIGVPSLILNAAQAAGWYLRDTYTWVKITPSSNAGAGKPTGSDRSQAAWEPIYYFRKPDRESGRPYAAYWDKTALPTNVIFSRPVGDPDHPCPWPPELARQLILATTPPGGWAIDPFGGTGTTVLEALESDRRGVSIDLSEPFSTTAAARVEDYLYHKANALIQISFL